MRTHKTKVLNVNNIHFFLHASMSYLIRVYRSNYYLPHNKILYNLHEEISSQTHQLPPELSQKNMAEIVILKTSKLTLSKKINTSL